MTERFATTPFGGRSLSHAMFAAQERVADARRKLLAADSEGNPTPAADKWRLLRSLTEARAVYGLSDRTIAVLEALLSFHQRAELDGREPLIVFPSNAELSMRTRGMAPATLRRHLAALVDAQMIIRRDSPNGKRYARRSCDGEIKSAFGFDLAPLALRADEIEGHATAARALARALQGLRTEITIHLRDIAKTIGAGISEGRAGRWEELSVRLDGLSGRVARNATKDELSKRHQELSRLR
ncbi:plasmid replication protein RepC, partial [Pseudaminobacter soli (ex Li et al. 2025)]